MSTACPLCGGEGTPAFVKAGHPHLACRACATWFVSPIPTAEALADFYRRAHAEVGSRLCWEGPSTHAHALWTRALDAAARRGGGPVLDVGCGAGQFLAFARARGFDDLAGVELAPQAAAEARRGSGAEVHEGDLGAAPLRAGHHGLVTLWDVLEHLADPGAVLARAATLLRPGGLLAVATPNRCGASVRAFGAGAQVVTPPEHLLVATRRGLSAALARAGLTVLRVDALELRLREWTGRGEAPGPAGGAPSTAGRDRYRRAYQRLTGSGLFPLLHAGGNAVLAATGLGDQLLALAERPAAGAPGEVRR